MLELSGRYISALDWCNVLYFMSGWFLRDYCGRNVILLIDMYCRFIFLPRSDCLFKLPSWHVSSVNNFIRLFGMYRWVLLRNIRLKCSHWRMFRWLLLCLLSISLFQLSCRNVHGLSVIIKLLQL